MSAVFQKGLPYPKLVALIKDLIQIGTVNKENALIRSKSRLAGCRTLYIGQDILPSYARLSALAERQIQVHIIPDPYYRDLQEDTRWH